MHTYIPFSRGKASAAIRAVNSPTENPAIATQCDHF